MKKWYQFLSSSIIALLLLTTPVSGQENEPAPSSVPNGGESASTEAERPAGQEVEINEDNYRQFMELRDAMQQRDVIPENIFKPGSGLQKLEKLPEESQKHLRNQLREIIVQGDPWQPGDETTEYPYSPSAAASTDPVLEKQELEAWGELVASYHDRESQIYENSSGSQAARGSEQGSSNAQNGTGQPGSNSQVGEGNQGQEAGQESSRDQAATEGTFSLNGSTDPNANNTAGVSQNAMEFLQGMGQGGGSAGRGEQGDSATPSGAQSQVQTDPINGAGLNAPANNDTPNSARDTTSESVAGTSQNAMEFLKGNNGQGEGAGESSTASAGENEKQGGAQGSNQDGTRENGQEDGRENGQDEAQGEEQESDQGDEQTGSGNNVQTQDEQQTEVSEEPASNISPAGSDPASPAEPDEESTDGASQNALEYLTGEGDQANEGTGTDTGTTESAGTLTIQDLLNARGVGSSKGINPASSGPNDEQQPDENIPGKDGDS